MKSRLPQGYGGGKSDMLKKFQDMQKQLEEKTSEIENMTFTAASGGGAVKATVSGKKHLQSINISPEVIDPNDTEMLEDLIISAVNEAMNKVDEMTDSKMSQITSGLPFAGLS